MAKRTINIVPEWANDKDGGVAQMVERSLSMREVRGSIPRISKPNLFVAKLFYNTLSATGYSRLLIRIEV